MKIARVRVGGAESWAVVRGERLELAGGDPFTGLAPTGIEVALADTTLLAPVTPRKVVAIARNYRAHAAEMSQPVPEEAPLFFLKSPTAVIGSGEAIVLPRGVGRIEYEGELAVIIGKTARHVPESRALDHVLGYTCLNDVTARELQRKLNHFTQAKGYDTFCPLGPWIETELDPRDLAIESRKNGQVVQSGRTSEMVHPIERLIAVLSEVFTLEPGDVIATGTPKGVGPLVAGDTLSVSVEGLGELSNPVIEA